MSGGVLQRMRRAGVFLALFAFALKAMLPAGYMVAARADGLVVELCGTLGAERADHDDRKSQHDQRQSDAHCVFATLSAPALTADAIALPAPRGAHATFVATPYRAAPAAPHTGPPLPARGPPILV